MVERVNHGISYILYYPDERKSYGRRSDTFLLGLTERNPNGLLLKLYQKMKIYGFFHASNNR